MLTIVIMSDDDKELNECLTSLWQIAKTPRTILIIDLGLKQPKKLPHKIISSKWDGKGKVAWLNSAIGCAESEYILCMDCRCRIEQKELEAMLLMSDNSDIVSPAIVNRGRFQGMNSDFFLFKKSKSFFPIQNWLISYHYDKFLANIAKVGNIGAITRFPNITNYSKKELSREDYRYKRDLFTYENIKKQW